MSATQLDDEARKVMEQIKSMPRDTVRKRNTKEKGNKILCVISLTITGKIADSH